MGKKDIFGGMVGKLADSPPPETNLEEFELYYNVLEPVFISKYSKLIDFDIREGDIIITIRRKKL